jgi:glyoxylase-like metal-dependent hydrolase (beta-lactamase superfamily II)
LIQWSALKKSMLLVDAHGVMMRKRFALTVTAAVLMLAGATGSHAQPADAPPAAPFHIELHALTPTVYWGKGGNMRGSSNVGVIIGDRGVTVVDTTSNPSTGKDLLAAIAKITPKPVTTVIITHIDGDHTGGLSAFPAGLKIIAQDFTLKTLQANAAAGRGPVPADRVPNHGVTYREDAVLNGVKVELLHWAPAHTAGDLAIYLPTQKIVFSGDIFCLDQPRAFVKLQVGGTSEGWIRSARGVLALNVGRIVPGHGTVQDKESIQKFTDVSIKEREQVKVLVAEGETVQQIEAAVGDPPPGWPEGVHHFTPYSAVIYQELTGKTQ